MTKPSFNSTIKIIKKDFCKYTSKKIALLFFLFFINLSLAKSQIRYSQFYSSPLLFNPAYTGRFNKNYRVGGAFRREVNAKEQIYTQSTLFFDSKILTSITPENDCFAIGVLALAEKSDVEGIKNTYFSFSMGYQKGLDEEGKQQIGIGFQTTYARKQLIKPKYVFEDQLLSWINSGYTNIDIFQLNNVDVSYVDVNAGLVYQGRINSKNFFSAGVSMYHINKPFRVFQGGELLIPRHLWCHFAWEKNISDNQKLYSALLISISNKSVNDLLAGLTYQLSINKNNSFILGGWFRKNMIRGNSLVPTVGLNFNGISINTSYDINISKKTTSQKGANEISMIYTIAKNREKFLENKFIKF